MLEAVVLNVKRREGVSTLDRIVDSDIYRPGPWFVALFSAGAIIELNELTRIVIITFRRLCWSEIIHGDYEGTLRY